MQNFLYILIICSITMSVVSVLFMLLSILISKKYSAKWQYYAWIIIIAGFIIPFRPNFNFTLFSVPVPVSNLEITIDQNFMEHSFDEYLKNMIRDTDNYAKDTISSDISNIETGISNTPAGENIIEPEPTIPVNTAHKVSIYEAAFLIWIVGALIILGYNLSRYFLLMKMVNRWKEDITDKRTLAILTKQKKLLNINKNISIKICPLIAGSMLAGLIKPVVLLQTTNYSNEKLSFIIRHELVHFKRKDLFLRILILTAKAIHWFNPVIYLTGKAVFSQCEKACDEAVVGNSGHAVKERYALFIADIVKTQKGIKTALTTNLYDGKDNIKNRLSSIVSKGKKRTGTIIAVIVIIAVLATGLIIAINTNKPIDENLKQDTEPQTDEYGDTFDTTSLNYLEQLPETNKLVLYRTFSNQILFDAALKIFNRMYPYVEVEVIDFVVDYNEAEYIERLKTEIPAGKGPDLLFMSEYSGFPDIYKVMDTGVFCDLNDFIRSDSNFNLDDYNKVVLDSGIYKNKRYIMPLDYQTNILLSTKEAMAQAGMNIENLQSFDGFTSEIKKYLEMNASTKLIYNYTRRSYNMLFPWCGQKLIDCENKKVNVDGNDFKKVMEAYKDIYRQDRKSEPQYINDTDLDAVVKGLISGEYLFYKPYAMNFFTYNYSALLAVDQTPIYVPVLSTDGKKVGSVYNSAAILKSSTNKANAYAFLKILLSEDIQDADPVEVPISYNPVLNNAMEKRIKSYGEYRNTYEGKAASVSEEILREYNNMQTDVDECQLYTGIPEALLKEIFTNYMLPYFKNEDSYENCLNKTRNFLELYLSE